MRKAKQKSMQHTCTKCNAVIPIASWWGEKDGAIVPYCKKCFDEEVAALFLPRRTKRKIVTAICLTACFLVLFFLIKEIVN